MSKGLLSSLLSPSGHDRRVAVNESRKQVVLYPLRERQGLNEWQVDQRLDAQIDLIS